MSHAYSTFLRCTLFLFCSFRSDKACLLVRSDKTGLILDFWALSNCGRRLLISMKPMYDAAKIDIFCIQDKTFESFVLIAKNQ